MDTIVMDIWEIRSLNGTSWSGVVPKGLKLVDETSGFSYEKIKKPEKLVVQWGGSSPPIQGVF
jgi:hypothetical protein